LQLLRFLIGPYRWYALARVLDSAFSDVMSVYRTHSQGKWTSMTEEQQSNGFAKMQEFIAREFVQEESETTLNSKA